MTKRLLIGVAALCLVLGACGGGDDENTKPEGCQTEADCADGEVCDNGTCKPEVKPACDPACTGATPICDEANGVCKTCMADTDCGGGTPICDTAANDGKGQCVGCRDTDDCTAPSVCDTTTHTCVGCTETLGCSGETPVCEEGHCVACTATAGCDAGEICDLSAPGGKCVICTATAGCGPAEICDTAAADGAGACVTCLADGTGCEAPTATCDTSVPGGLCVGCVDDNDCSGSEICDDATKTCLRCKVTDGEGPDEGCTGGWPHCDPSAKDGKGDCFGCLEDAHCADDYPICDPVKRACATCVDHDDCAGTNDGATPYCKLGFPGKCVACLADGTGCGEETPACNADASAGLGECWSCYGTVGCENPEFCDATIPGGVCSICNDRFNRCPSSAPVCDTSVAGGACVECVEDTDCDAGEACDANVCRPAVVVEIEAVRAAPVSASLDLPVTDAVVTYLRPTTGGDKAGFFVQAGPTGPAMLVMVDPATLDPVPAIGDTVSFHVIEKAVYGSATEVMAVSSWAVTASGFDVTPWIQDLAAATDTITGLDAYEAELVSIAGTIVGDFGGAGSEHVSARFTTAGIPAADNNLRLRLAATLNNEVDLGDGCTFSLVAGPMWRFNAQAQPSAYHLADLSGITCPGPKVVSATALTADTVEVTFDRLLDPASIVAGGAQFTFDNGLVASAATVAGKKVTVTTAAAMTPGTSYTVTVAATVLGKYGTALGATNTATFTGFGVPSAVLAISEINPRGPGGMDLIELYALQGGSVNGITVKTEDNTTAVLATLPDAIVATGDLIVIHITPDANSATETQAKDEKPVAQFSANYDTAWDVRGASSGMSDSAYRVVVVRDEEGALMDAGAFGKPTATPSAPFVAKLAEIQAAGEWLPADCGGAPCSTASTPAIVDITVNWSAADNTVAGNSLQRKHTTIGTPASQLSDWVLAPSSWGVVNTVP